MSEHNFEDMIPAYLGDKPYIFISYSHRDSESVKEDIRYMNSEGYHIWYDEGIEIGKDWPDELATAIQNCTQFIVYISRYSIKSEHVKDEIFYALNNNKKIVPIYLEELTLPSGLGLKLGSKQGIMQYQLNRAMYNAYLCKALYPECKEQDHREQDRQKQGMGVGLKEEQPGIIPAKRASLLKKIIPGTPGRLIGAIVLIGIICVGIIFTIKSLGFHSGVTPESALQNASTSITGIENSKESSVTATGIAVNANQGSNDNSTGISDIAGTSTETSQSPDQNSSAFTPDETLDKLLGDIDVSISVEDLAAQIRKKMPVLTEVTTRSAIDTTSRGFATGTARKLLLQSRISNAKSQIQNIKDQRLVLAENNKRGKTYIADLDLFNKAELVTRIDNIGKLIPYIDTKLEFGNLSADDKSLILNKKSYLVDLDKKIRSIIGEVTDLRTRQNEKIAEREKQDKTLETQENKLATDLSGYEKELEALNTAEENTVNAPKYTGGN